jgi:fatty acid desaturase
VTQTLSGKTLIAEISKPDRQVLFAKSNARGLLQLAGHLSALAFCGGYILAGALAWPLMLIPYSIILICLFMPLHETIHQTAFRSNWLNSVVSFFCGLMVVIPPVWFRYFHFDHHRFTSDPRQDPELAIAKPATRRAYIWHLTGLAIWKSLVGTLIRNALGQCQDSFVPGKALSAVRTEALVFLIVYVGLVAGSIYLESVEIFWLWLLPVMVGQSFLRAYLLAEHMLCPESPDMLENSRTVQCNALLRFFTWNMPYHAEHHLLPAVPFHRLPDLYSLTKPNLQTLDTGYASVHGQIWRSLK